MPGTDTTFESNVMAPVTVTAPANNLPQDVAPVSIVMVVSASTFPLNTEYLLMVAELPTCQNRLQSDPPLIIFTDELLAVVSELPMRKMKTELGLPNASKVSVPVNWADEAKQ